MNEQNIRNSLKIIVDLEITLRNTVLTENKHNLLKGSNNYYVHCIFIYTCVWRCMSP